MQMANAKRYPMLLWASFDQETNQVEDMKGFKPSGGDPLHVRNGTLSGLGCGYVYIEVDQRPERIETGFYPQTKASVSALLVRVVDIGQHYAVQVDIDAKMFQLFEVTPEHKTLLMETPIPFLEPSTGFHANLVVEDDGKHLRCLYLDYGLVLDTACLANGFDNLYLDAKQIGLDGIGQHGSHCCYLRAWETVPDWDGERQVEPMLGAQHIWTKTQQRFVGEHDRSYWGWCTVWGEVQLRWYDHNLRRFGPIETVFAYPGNVKWAYDDHHPPGIYVHEDGHVWVWIQSHKSQDPFVLLRSKKSEDIGGWQDPINMNAQGCAPKGGVYPRAYRVKNGDVVLFHRVGGSNDGEWFVRRSADGGIRWDCMKIIDNSEGHVYQFIRQNPNNPDHIVLVGNHKDTSTKPFSWRRIYVWETVDGGRSFQTVSNQQTIALPAKRTDLEPVYTDATHQLFVTGFAIQNDGKPLILAAYKDNPDHEICAFSWHADHWQKCTVCKNEEWPGAGTYPQNVWRPSGGDVNPLKTDEICIAVAVDGVHEIQRWVGQKGCDWEKVADVTRGSVVKNFRPIYIENPHPEDWHILWHSGEFYGTTEAIGQSGRHFDRFDDVRVVNELLVDTLKKNADV